MVFFRNQFEKQYLYILRCFFYFFKSFYKNKKEVHALFLVFLSFLVIAALPITISVSGADTCLNQQVVVNTINDFIAAEKIRLGQHLSILPCPHLFCGNKIIYSVDN